MEYRGEQPNKELHDIRDIDQLRQAVLHLLGVAEEFVKPLVDIANKCQAYYQGNPWYRGDETSLGRGRAGGANRSLYRLKKDIVEPAVSAVHPLLIRGAPQMTVDARHPDEPAEYGVDGQYYPIEGVTDRDVANIFTEIIEGLWHKRKEAMDRSKVILQSLVEGVSFRSISVGYDRELGWISYPKILMRDQFLGDPEGTDLGAFRDFRYVFFKKELSAAQIESRFGLKEKDYAGHSQTEGRSLDETQTGLVRRSWVGQADGGVKAEYSVPKYEVHELYWNTEMPDVVAEQLEDGLGRGEMSHEMKYLVMVNRYAFPNLDRGGMRRNPWWHGDYPAAAYCHSPLLAIAHGYSMVARMLGPQDFVNIMYNQIARNVMQRGNSSWMVEEGAVKQANFKRMGMPGAVIPVMFDALRMSRIKEVPPGDFGTATNALMNQEIAYGQQSLGDSSPTMTGQTSASIRSGKHAQTVLESGNTQFAEQMRMLEAGHERSAELEVKTLQQVADFSLPYFDSHYNLSRFPMIDLALRDLICDVALDSKTNLPSTSISGMLNYYWQQYDRGAISLHDALKFTGLLDQVDEEWAERVRAASREAIPGLPYVEQVIQKVMQQSQLNDLIQGQISAGGGREGEDVPSLPPGQEAGEG